MKPPATIKQAMICSRCATKCYSSTHMNAATKKRRGNVVSQIRFDSDADHQLVKRAAAHAGLSMNAWLVLVATGAATRELTPRKRTPRA